MRGNPRQAVLRTPVDLQFYPSGFPRAKIRLVRKPKVLIGEAKSDLTPSTYRQDLGRSKLKRVQRALRDAKVGKSLVNPKRLGFWARLWLKVRTFCGF